MRIFKPRVLIGLAVVLGMTGCKADTCEERPAEAQIDVVLDGINSDKIKGTDVKLTIDNDRSADLYFYEPAPSFVFEFEDWDTPPRELTIQVVATDGDGRVLGTGETQTTFSSDGCNFFSVKVRPGEIPGTWVTIPPEGAPLPVTFYMGSPTGENCGNANETWHQVTLTHAYEISAHEVTQGEFDALMGYNPSEFTSCGSNCPVDYVNWHMSAAYCNALSAFAGLDECYSCTGSRESVTCSVASSYSEGGIYSCPGYRLPTEAEWEHAYRAGSDTPLYPSPGNDGSITNCQSSDPNADKIGWYFYNNAVSYEGCNDLTFLGGDPCSGTHPKGTKAPNSWGLYDMGGNVWEWCHDWYQEDLGSTMVDDPWGASSGSHRVSRGGAWDSAPFGIRAALRLHDPPEHRGSIFGFRCCRTK